MIPNRMPNGYGYTVRPLRVTPAARQVLVPDGQPMVVLPTSLGRPPLPGHLDANYRRGPARAQPVQPRACADACLGQVSCARVAVLRCCTGRLRSSDPKSVSGISTTSQYARWPGGTLFTGTRRAATLSAVVPPNPASPAVILSCKGCDAARPDVRLLRSVTHVSARA